MTIEIREEGALIEGFKPGYYGCDCCHKDDCGCPDTGDTPTPPGPEPPTPDTGITSIHIIVADTITDSGRASAVFTPATADTSLYFSSSDEDIAEIDPDTGEITVIQTGVVTFCVEDLLTGLEDCKVVNVIKSVEPEPPETGITSIHIIVEDTITDFGTAGVEFEPATADTSFVFSSSDENIAVIDPDTGEIEVLETGFVTFCVEDLLTTLRDCKTVYVIKSVDPGPCPETDEFKLKVVYYITSTTVSTVILHNTNGIVEMELSNGTVLSPTKRYRFNTAGLQTVYYKLNTNVLNGTLSGNTSVVEAEIPTCVETIGYSCFNGCHNLSAVTIPCSVEHIDDYAFYYCNNLEAAVLPPSLEIIGMGAFGFNEALTSVTIPSSVRSISTEAFVRCTHLREVNMQCSIPSSTGAARTPWWDMFPGCGSLSAFTGPNASSDGRMLITNDNIAVAFAPSGLTRYTIPRGVVRIETYCFYNLLYSLDNLTEITIPDSVVYIDDSAFYGCNYLKNLTIGRGIMAIGKKAFENTNRLECITIYATTAPMIDTDTFRNAGTYSENKVLRYPQGSNYSSWLSSEMYYLGFYGWTGQEITG